MKQIIKQALLTSDLSGAHAWGLKAFYARWVLRFRGSHVSIDGTSRLALMDLRLCRNTTFKLKGRGNTVKVQGELDDVSVNVSGDGNSVIIAEGAHITWTELTIIANDSTIVIGPQTTINGKASQPCLLLARGEPSQIRVGRDCMFSYGVEIRTSDSHQIFDHDDRRINLSQDILIEDHVWIGGKALVMKGVSIRTGAIVGACSLVTREVPASSVAAGMPAKVIRSGIRWAR